MKTKLFILLLLASLTTIAFAQLATNCPQFEKGNENKWQIGVNVNTVIPITEAGFDYIVGQSRLFGTSAGADSRKKDNSYSLGLHLSSKIKADCAFRLSAKLINYKIDETYNEDAIYVDNGQIRQSVLNILPGIMWDINYKKLTLYYGFQLDYKRYSPLAINLTYIYYQTLPNPSVAVRNIDLKQDGGFSIGTGLFAGFSVKISKSISIGAEFSSAYTYYKTGGTITQIITDQPATNFPTKTWSNNYQGLKFSSIVSAINISISF